MADVEQIVMKNPRDYLTERQWRALMRHVPEPLNRNRMILYTLAMTGRRVSEVVRCLKPSDILWKERLINYTILKRRRPTKKLLPASRKLLKVLYKYCRQNRIRRDAYIFPLSRQMVDVVIKKAAAEAGISAAHAHAFRHGFAIEGARRLKSPAHLVVLKDMLGHARVDTTMFYLRYNPTDQQALAEEMWSPKPHSKSERE